jgi:hypothetical protein
MAVTLERVIVKLGRKNRLNGGSKSVILIVLIFFLQHLRGSNYFQIRLVLLFVANQLPAATQSPVVDMSVILQWVLDNMTQANLILSCVLCLVALTVH